MNEFKHLICMTPSEYERLRTKADRWDKIQAWMPVVFKAMAKMAGIDDPDIESFKRQYLIDLDKY